MKTFNHIYVLLCFLFISLTSCQLTEDIEDYKPSYSLDAETAINNQATAELALGGVYSGFRQRSTSSGNPEIYLLPSVLSGAMAPSIFNTGAEPEGYMANNPVSVNTGDNLGAYTRMYDIVNRCNWFIEKVSGIADSEFSPAGRKSEMIGEVKAIRATANFYLLRLWGQFYDTGSAYGITLRTDSARSAEAFPRNTVEESYEAIISDLDDAIANAPDLRAKYYTNKIYAKGLKAKVLLYKGDYPQAAVLAKDVIDNSGADFELTTPYTSIFDGSSESLFNSPEVLFGVKGTPDENIGIGNFVGFYAGGTPALEALALGSTDISGQNITHDGSRFSSLYFTDFFGLVTYKYNANGPYSMIYQLRMAEVYLIHAEAAARAAGTVTPEALASLNAVRVRAGATTTGGDGFETYPATISLSQFLEAVRIEKYIELAMEQGEEWFDLVRYHFVDGFDVTTVKPTATDPDKYILPIDQNSIDAGGNVVEQNPGY